MMHFGPDNVQLSPGLKDCSVHEPNHTRQGPFIHDHGGCEAGRKLERSVSIGPEEAL